MLVEGLGGSLPTEGFAGAVVEHGGDCINGLSVPAREIGALGEVLAQEAVRVLIRSTLPRAAGVGEEDWDVRLDFKCCVLREFLAPVPSEGSEELCWEVVILAASASFIVTAL